MMKHMEIFEQAMCCPTGLCGPSIDPELLRVSTVLDTLKQHGIDVGRYNLTSAPLKFVQTKAVTDFLQHHGALRYLYHLLFFFNGFYPKIFNVSCNNA